MLSKSSLLGFGLGALAVLLVHDIAVIVKRRIWDGDFSSVRGSLHTYG